MPENAKKTKILYLITQSEWGGAQKYVFDLAKHLPTDKYVIEIGVGRDGTGRWQKYLAQRGYKVYHLKHVVRNINLWHDFLSSFELFNLLAKSKPDVVHLSSSKIGSTGAIIAWLYKKLHHKKLKIIYTVHGFVTTEPVSILKRKFFLWAEKISGLVKDTIICVSEFDKNVGLNNHIANHKKFITIHNGLDLNDINFLDKKTARRKISDLIDNSGPEHYWIGTIANHYSTKGLDCLIRSAKNICDKRDDVIFINIGDGPLRKRLADQIKKMKLQNKFFLLGPISKAAEHLLAFDIFCLPSVKEGFPYTLIEALAAGLPIVTTQVGGTLEIIEPDVNGLISLPKKPAEFAKAIEKLLDDEDLRNKFRRNNLAKAKKFSLEKMVQETEKVYQS